MQAMHCRANVRAPAGCRAFRPFAVGKTRPLRLHPVLVAAPVLQATTTDAFDQLAQHADATVSTAVGPTPLGRGLVATRHVAPRDPVVSVPIQNALLIADDPINGISIFSDRQHRRWQEAHGQLPEQLMEFLQGDARWDIRMAAWLLYMKQHRDPLWTSYMQHLPQEQDICCLLNYNRDEIAELQVPALQQEAIVQADWAAFLHGNYLHSKSGKMAALGLSDNLPLSLWAISMVRSRTFSEDVNGECLTLMVPYADLANHNFDNNCTFCMSRDYKSFQLQALRPLIPGEEITISYGAIKPNAELLRDYGFFIPGNPCDRVKFRALGSSSSSSSSSLSSADGTEGLPGLNPILLLEAVGFTGDLATAQVDDTVDIKPALQPCDVSPHGALRLARRKAALLSMPLDAPPTAASARGSSSSSINSKESNGFDSWWFGESMQAWTPAGQPTALPLTKRQVPAERAAIDVLKQQLLQQLALLPTSIATDEQLLQLHEEASASSSGLGSGGMGKLSGDCVSLPVSSIDSSDWKVHRHADKQRLSQSAAAGRGKAAKAPFNNRVATAIGARLEHKLLLREAVAVLMMYDQYLATQF